MWKTSRKIDDWLGDRGLVGRWRTDGEVED